MKKSKVALLLLIVMGIALAASACSLFGGGDDTDDSGMPEAKKRFYYDLGDYFVTNVKDSAMKSKTSVALMMTKDEAATLDQNKSAIRNIVVKILRSKTEDEMLADDIIDTLQNEMTEQIGELLNMDTFKNVVISDFVVE